MKAEHKLNNENISKLYHGAKQKLLIIIICPAGDQFKFAYLSKRRFRQSAEPSLRCYSA